MNVLNFLAKIIEFLDTSMPTPQIFGWFHILSFVLMVIITVLLCRFYKPDTDGRRARRVILITAIIVTLLEIYKQINYTFSVNGGVISADYQWYAFPFQFCSTPMYVGLLTAVFKKGRVHNCLAAYLATFALFAGGSVMIYAGDVFISTIGINVQTMVCHGSMIVVGVYLLYTGYVKLEHKTILKALPVFSAAVAIACVLNEIAYLSGLLSTENFNMFFVSPHQPPHLPVYSLIQPIVPYPLNLVIYIAGFTAAAYVVLLAAMLIKKIFGKKHKEIAQQS